MQLSDFDHWETEDDHICDDIWDDHGLVKSGLVDAMACCHIGGVYFLDWVALEDGDQHDGKPPDRQDTGHNITCQAHQFCWEKAYIADEKLVFFRKDPVLIDAADSGLKRG